MWNEKIKNELYSSSFRTKRIENKNCLQFYIKKSIFIKKDELLTQTNTLILVTIKH
jgi:hypothetical protein